MLILLLGTASAQENSSPCKVEGFRDFDFWIGEWDVYSGDQIVGYNKVELILDSCVIMENWEGSNGSKGHSFNSYDPITDRWMQTWVDNSGSTYYFKGLYSADSMVMYGDNPVNGKSALFKMTYVANPNGTVRQIWKMSADSGNNYITWFDGLYVRKGEEKPKE